MLHTEPLTAQAKSYLGLNHEGLEGTSYNHQQKSS